MDIRKIDNPEGYWYLFNDNYFYLGTKRPSSLNNTQRNSILSNSYIIYFDNVEIGYIFVNKKSKKFVAISIIICNGKFTIAEKMDCLMKSVFQYFAEKEKYGETYLYVEGYNTHMLNYCQNSSILKNIGCLRNNIYKLGRYYNSFVFKKRENYYV